MKAVILAGGAGSRLKPLTDDKPKPMVPIINTPVLEYIIGHLRKHGFTEIALTLGYKADVIKDYFGNGKKQGVRLEYFTESSPLGTAGGVKAASSFIDGDFLVMSGDAFTDMDVSALMRFHMEKGGIGTIALSYTEDSRGFGVVKTAASGEITEFLEKPAFTTEKRVNTGIYAFKHDVLRFIPDGFYDFGRDLFPRLIGKIYGYDAVGYWSDIGTLPAYYRTNQIVAEQPARFGFVL
ncbi:MAG: nucleotidyltransferase family protein [Clostridiaceae bacterium]|jgi:NDP-sugar pyrophosphorylase family protein|nr:nucleotidyltransferase family protein [Clostridiaceae bacterium]